MWANLGIRQKVFILFSILTLLPLIVIISIWLRTSRSQLVSAAINRQNIYLSSSADSINNQIAAKVSSVISQSQDSSVTNLDAEKAKLKLLQYANQENDVVRVALVDAEGNEKVVVANHELVSAFTNVKASEAFKVVTQISNDALIGEVTYQNSNPEITVSVPLLAFSKLGSQNLTSAEAIARRSGSDVKGALIVQLSISDLLSSILSNRIGGDSYTYVVDAKGKILAHPDVSFMKAHPDVSKTTQVAEFLAKPTNSIAPATTASEKGVRVISSSYSVKNTGWAVIIQEPVNSILEPSNTVVRLAIIIFSASALLSIGLSLFFSSNITRPISKLVKMTTDAGEGNLDLQIPIESTDEIGVLARRFNLMTYNLSHMISNMRTESMKLNVVLNSVDEGIVATDTLNNVVFSNISAAVLAGVLPTELNGKRFDSIFKLVDGKQPFVINPNSNTVAKDIIYISPNERIHFLDIAVNKIENDPEGISNIITLRDQTDERELEAMKLDFVSMAAHELRTPLTAVRGYLSLLSADKSSNLSVESRQSVERAQSSTKQIVGLINNLLNVSKIERGSLNLSYTKLDWAKTVISAINDHKFSADEKKISISYEGPDEGIPLMADELAIREVLNNLIANAIHYTDIDGAITVGVRAEEKYVTTYVRDTGIGMTPNILKHLFTKFYRAKGPLSSGSGGTGLGLYISKSIVELHQGKISVESEFGKGTTFTFSLPVYDAVQYEELGDQNSTGVKKSRGWITKNITG